MPDTAVIDSPSTATVEAPSAPVAPSTETVSTSNTESTQPAPGRTGPSYQERADRLTGKARDHYRLTGDLTAAERKQTKTSDAPADSSTATEEPGPPRVQTEPASGPGEPKPSRQDRDWVNLRKKNADNERELTAVKAKLEVYSPGPPRRGPS